MRILKLFKLSRRQWLWFFIAYPKLLMVQIQLRFRHRAWAVREIKRYKDESTIHSGSQLVANKIACELHESVRLAARTQLLSTHCLPKALVLAEMLHSRGGAAQIHLGVSKLTTERAIESAPQALLASHAWVELEGVPIGEPENLDSNFTRLTL